MIVLEIVKGIAEIIIMKISSIIGGTLEKESKFKVGIHHLKKCRETIWESLI